LTVGIEVIIPEIADYEVRRSLLLEGLTKSVERLDKLKDTLTYLPLNTPMMLKAAELWAEMRKAGQPTADPKALDGDVILAAQALEVGGIIATENVGHLSRFTEARHWKDITIELFHPALTFPKSAFDVEYPIQDFLDDIDKTVEPRKSKVIDYPFSLNIPGESNKKETFIDELKTIGHFTNKYGDQLGPARLWRCKVTREFLSKTEDVLIQHGIVTRQADHSTINEDFLSYLLNIKLDTKTKSIPENAIETYLQKKQ
jgi:predicted nucleic acid-binding protein